MSTTNFENLLATLKENAPELSREVAAVRQDFSQMMRNLPVEQDLVQEV